MVATTQASDNQDDQVNSCGTVAEHVEIRICRPADGQTCSVGEVGEIQIRGSLTMAGYFKDSKATAATIDRDGWLRTGDLASVDERGYLFIAGRLKEMIIRGGENIYPREIEDRLLAIEVVAAAALVGVPDACYGEVAVAFVKAAPGRSLSAIHLRGVLAAEMAGYKIPARWYFVDELPLTPSGKVQKFILREGLARGEYTPEAIK